MCITSDVDRKNELPIAKVKKYKCINCRSELYEHEKQCFHCSFNINNFRQDLDYIFNNTDIYIKVLENYNFHEVLLNSKNKSNVDKICVVCSRINKYDKICPHCKFNVTLFYKYCKDIYNLTNYEIRKIVRALEYNT